MKTNCKNTLTFMLALISASAVFAATPTPNQAGRIQMVREVAFFVANYCVISASGASGMVEGVNFGEPIVTKDQASRMSSNFYTFDVTNRAIINKSAAVVDAAYARANMKEAGRNLVTRAVSKIMAAISNSDDLPKIICTNADLQLQQLAQSDYNNADPAYLASEFEGFKLEETIGFTYNQLVSN